MMNRRKFFGFLGGAVAVAVVAVPKQVGLREGEVKIIGYKGKTAFDAGCFYCPYVPLQFSAHNRGSTADYVPVTFKTRYNVYVDPHV